MLPWLTKGVRKMNAFCSAAVDIFGGTIIIRCRPLLLAPVATASAQRSPSTGGAGAASTTPAPFRAAGPCPGAGLSCALRSCGTTEVAASCAELPPLRSIMWSPTPPVGPTTSGTSGHCASGATGTARASRRARPGRSDPRPSGGQSSERRKPSSRPQRLSPHLSRPASRATRNWWRRCGAGNGLRFPVTGAQEPGQRGPGLECQPDPPSGAVGALWGL